MKKLMIAAAASCLSAGACAQSSVTIYGSLDAGVAYINNLGGGSVTRLDQGTMQPDRIGFRGVEDLGGGLSANFQLEAGFYTDSGSVPNSSKLFNRYSTVGLAGSFGAVTMGHMPDVVFDYVGKLSNAFQLTNWYLFHPGNLDSLANTYQLDNAVRYTTPTAGGFQGSLMVGFGEVAGDNANGRNISAGATYTNGPLRAALAYSKLNNRAAGYAGTFLTSVGLGNAATVFNSLTTYAGGVGYTIGPVRLNADYTQVKLALPTGATPKQKNADLGAAWRYNTLDTLNFGYGFSKLEGARWNTLSLSHVHDFSKRTQWYAQAAYQRAGGTARFAVMNGTGASGATGVSGGRGQLVTTIGMHHSF
ncbi:porin [Herbaspirillum sp. YR522]|uniref:porin n=1 Tax=Herbaspirillum sp. YR522 TaxID=1144342 RepID=UPI00026F5C5C|nr:porin [Herbaspirillum sp. YR522]EJN08370.1 outer membrane protein (porin) [Herbaspirillum sp. YR522]